MKITKSHLKRNIKEEIKAVLEQCGEEPDEGEEMPPEEPTDATAGMTDDEVMRLAAALAAQAESWDEEW